MIIRINQVNQSPNLSGDMRGALSKTLGEYGFAINFLLSQWVATTFAQFTANKDNFNIGDARLGLFSSDAARNLTGVTPGIEGRIFPLVNTGAQNIVLKHQSASSSAENRIITKTGADFTLAGGAPGLLWYDLAALRWRQFI